MEKLDLTHIHISGEILYCCDLPGWQSGNIHQMENVFPSTQESVSDSYPKESISIQQCMYV